MAIDCLLGVGRTWGWAQLFRTEHSARTLPATMIDAVHVLRRVRLRQHTGRGRHRAVRRVEARMPELLQSVDTASDGTASSRARRLAEAAGCTTDELFAEIERLHRLIDDVGEEHAIQQFASEAGLTVVELRAEMERLAADS